MAITAFLSHSPGMLNRGPGGPASLGHIPHSCILSSTATAQSGFLRAPFARFWFSLPHLISNRLNFLCTELYNSSTSTFFLWVSQIALFQPVHSQGYILIFLDRMHLLFTQVHFLFLTAWPGSICYKSLICRFYRSMVQKYIFGSDWHYGVAWLSTKQFPGVVEHWLKYGSGTILKMNKIKTRGGASARDR